MHTVYFQSPIAPPGSSSSATTGNSGSSSSAAVGNSDSPNSAAVGNSDSPNSVVVGNLDSSNPAVGAIALQVPEGTTLLEAAKAVGKEPITPCNGLGTCGKCKLKLALESLKNVRFEESTLLSAAELEEGYVLSCETGIFGDVTVILEERRDEEGLVILSGGSRFQVRLNPNIRKIYEPESNVTLVTAGGASETDKEILCREDGDTSKTAFGLSLDIGTTTLALTLVDLISGEDADSISALNPQTAYGQDVLSRIQYAGEESGLITLRDVLLNEVNRMVGELARRNAVNQEHIYEAVFSGNSCMLHLASGTDPGSLGRYPYTPAIDGAVTYKSSEFGLNIAKSGLVYFPPGISAYVGADITSGILASSLFSRRGVTLFVDVGTNGEMAIAADGHISAASTAAGPAFEGMNIKCGMRAGNGAIEAFEIVGDDVRVSVIGNVDAVGICGSGLIDIVGELVSHGVIVSNGKFASKSSLPPFLAERIEAPEGRTQFRVEGEVVLTQKDVRQVQLAKGAIRSGIDYLLKAKNTDAGSVDSVLIAGSFGYHLRARSLLNIGMLPGEFEGRIEFVGNTSSEGGKAFLLGRQYRREMERLVRDVEVLELANMEDFDRKFIQSLDF